MQRLKLWMLNKLLADVRLRRLALKELIGDKEVRQLHVHDVEKLEINECVILNSNFTHIRTGKLIGNQFESSTFTNNFMEPVEPIKLFGEEEESK
jgi:hypothetical protein